MDVIIEQLSKLAGPASPFIAVGLLGWYLRGRLTEILISGERRMVEHEGHDDMRHRQNLVRFAKMGERLGIDLHVDNGDELH